MSADGKGAVNMKSSPSKHCKEEDKSTTGQFTSNREVSAIESQSL